MNKYIFFPIKVVIIFLMITVVMYYISPFDWDTNHPYFLLIYNVLVFLCLYSGYLLGTKMYNKRINCRTFKINNYYVNLFRKNINVLLLLNIIFIYPKFIMKLGQGYVGIGYIFNSIVLGIISPEVAYLDKLTLSTKEFLSLSNPLVFSYFILSPLLYIVVPIMIYLWDEITNKQKVLTSLIIVLNILVYVSIGTNKGIFDYIIIIPFILYAKRHSLVQAKVTAGFSKRKKLMLFLITSLAITYFSAGYVGRTGVNFGYDSLTGKKIDRETLLINILPGFALNSYIGLDFYLTQGYFALDKTFDLDFIPSFGFGHSLFLTTLGEKVVGKGVINKRLYEFRLEKKINYSQTTRWHTFYVSIANDLSFIGVLAFIFILGYWFSIVWMDIIFRNNLLAVGIMPLFAIMFFYFSANNQVLGFEGQSFIFWVLLVLFFYSRKKAKHTLIAYT